MSQLKTGQKGFTLIELLMAMAVFSFMMLIIVTGMFNVIRIRSTALAANKVQDNARAAMNELVRAVRDSSHIEGTPGLNSLCLTEKGGSVNAYYLESGVLKRAENCDGLAWVNPVAITNDGVEVISFNATVETYGPVIDKLDKTAVKLSITVASRNGSTLASGACKDNNRDRTFCSQITLTSGAVSR